MHLQLKRKKLLAAVMVIRAYDPELDDIRAMLSDVCEGMADRWEFSMGGFGQEHWPVTVSTDLCVLLEQLPDLFSALRQGQMAELDMYEQGVQRTLHISPAKDGYAIRCSTYLIDWEPNPQEEWLSKEALHHMLSTIVDQFMEIVQEIASALLQHPWLVAWYAAALPSLDN